MCLGESTTAGQYPHFLEETLNQRDIGIKFSVIDKGIAGTNTGAILSRLESNLDAYHPDMVITMMGINDSGPHMPYEVLSDSKAFNVLRSFRTYKLARLLWLHIVTKWEGSNQLASSLRRMKSQKVDQEDEDALLILEHKENIELNPRSDEAYFCLGIFYQVRGEYSKAAEQHKKAIELNPKNDEAYLNLAISYQEQGEYSEADKQYKKAMELNPENDRAHFGLGSSYQEQGEYSKADEQYKKAIELNPKNDEACIGLGISYQEQGEYSKADEQYKKAMELNPKNDEAYRNLGFSYQQQGKLAASVEQYKKTIELNPENELAYIGLGTSYLEKGQCTEAVEQYKKAIEINPANDWALGKLAILYKEKGDPGLAREYGEQARELRTDHYVPKTVANYHKLKAILDKRDITYVCMQYPRRDLEPLKKTFQGDAAGIVFVDNEKPFKDALKKASYQEYFIDTFGGDFGHCTEKGNRLLAENIADTILKEVFNE